MAAKQLKSVSDAKRQRLTLTSSKILTQVYFPVFVGNRYWLSALSRFSVKLMFGIPVISEAVEVAAFIIFPYLQLQLTYVCGCFLTINDLSVDINCAIWTRDGS